MEILRKVVAGNLQKKIRLIASEEGAEIVRKVADAFSAIDPFPNDPISELLMFLQKEVTPWNFATLHLTACILNVYPFAATQIEIFQKVFKEVALFLTNKVQEATTWCTRKSLRERERERERARAR